LVFGYWVLKSKDPVDAFAISFIVTALSLAVAAIINPTIFFISLFITCLCFIIATAFVSIQLPKKQKIIFFTFSVFSFLTFDNIVLSCSSKVSIILDLDPSLIYSSIFLLSLSKI
jgi:hypothetical protein